MYLNRKHQRTYYATLEMCIKKEPTQRLVLILLLCMPIDFRLRATPAVLTELDSIFSKSKHWWNGCCWNGLFHSESLVEFLDIQFSWYSKPPRRQWRKIRLALLELNLFPSSILENNPLTFLTQSNIALETWDVNEVCVSLLLPTHDPIHSTWSPVKENT